MSFDTARRCIEAESIIDSAIERIRSGACSNPDALLRAITNTAAIDGRLIVPTTALTQGVRRIQKFLEREAMHA